MEFEFEFNVSVEIANSHFCLKLCLNVKFKCNSNLPHKFEFKSFT